MSLFLILKQLGQRLFFFFSGKCRSHLDCLSSKYTLYVYCHNVYSKCKRVNVVFMLFLFIYLYWCPTRFQCQMMFLSYYRKTRNVTSITKTSYTTPPGAPEFTTCSLQSSCCSIFSHLCSVLYITVCPFVSFTLAMILSVFCQFPFAMILSVFCQFPLAMLFSVFCQLHFGHDIVCLFRCTASGYLFDIFKPLLHSCENCHMPVICFFKVSTHGLYFPTIYAFIAY